MVICRVWMIHKVSEALACEYESAAEGAYRPGHHGSDLDKAHHMHLTRTLNILQVFWVQACRRDKN